MNRATIIFAIFLSLFMAPNVRAEAQLLSDTQIESIRLGCTNALQGLRIVQETEAASRVNRGRTYESTMRLITSLNSRVVLNKLDAPRMTSTAASLQRSIDSFQAHYIAYAEKMDQTIAINCKTAPVSFYDSLSSAREARALVAEDVRAIEEHLDEYQVALRALRTSITQPPQEAAQ